MSKDPPNGKPLMWKDLPFDTRNLLSGKLIGLWGASTDEQAFDALAIDKQHALLLLLQRLDAKDLWKAVKKVENVYGLGGVGMSFHAWPMIHSTLARRKDFTRRFAKHKHTTGGFYEKNRPTSVLHFIFQEGKPPIWYVHFDLHSPVFSMNSLLHHLRFEVVGKLKPDWRTIEQHLGVS